MAPFEAAQIDQHRIEQQEAISNALYLDGSTDAAMGYSPSSTDSAYLTGYVAELRKRIEEGESLQIRWLSPAFISGGYDAPDDCHCEF